MYSDGGVLYLQQQQQKNQTKLLNNNNYNWQMTGKIMVIST